MPLVKVMVFGTFDLLHPGHEFVLREAGKRGSVTVVVARDANVERIKKKTPHHSEGERMEAIQVKFPSYTVRLGDPRDFMAPVRETKPDLILLGYDQRMPPNVTEETLGCRVERLPSLEPHKYKTSLMKKVD